MYGPKLRIEYDEFGITLVPPKVEWAGYYAEMMSSLKVNMWTNGLYGLTEADEREWLEKSAKDPKGVSWAIMPDGCKLPVGNTGLHDISLVNGSCTSGIVIFDPEWWGKGVASGAHIIRTGFGADNLGRSTINSTVREVNEASRKALERVGYAVTGKVLRNCFRDGEYYDTLTLTWLHPERINLLYPQGLPPEYTGAVERASQVLKKARDLVKKL